jgi:hypothetical protein
MASFTIVLVDAFCVLSFHNWLEFGVEVFVDICIAFDWSQRLHSVSSGTDQFEYAHVFVPSASIIFQDQM